MAFAILASSCGSAQERSAERDGPDFGDAPKWIAEAPCSEDVVDLEVECYRVDVPADWENQSDGTTIQLQVRVVTSSATPESATPILLVPGGPGQSGLDSLGRSTSEHWKVLLDAHPMVFYSPRGTAGSTPALSCEPGEDDADCGTRLQSSLAGQDLELSSFTTRQAAHDIEALRLALGYSTWHLFGVSYGSRVGQAVLRQFPDGVDTAVFDGVVPISGASYLEAASSFVDALDALFAACGANARCDEAYPNLEARLWDLVDQLDNEPLNVPVDAGTTHSQAGDS